MRHTFRTIADETCDFPAILRVMGHSDHTISDHYRERISDERLMAVTEHVREWLFGYAYVLGYTEAAVELAKEIAKESRGELCDEETWRSRKNPLWDELANCDYEDGMNGRDALSLAGAGDEGATEWVKIKLQERLPAPL